MQATRLPCPNRPSGTPHAPTRWIAVLDATGDDARLQAWGLRFLRDKTITPLGQHVLDAMQRTTLAALCCLPWLELDEQGLHGWSRLILHANAFRVNRRHVDAADVPHEWDGEWIGEALEERSTDPVMGAVAGRSRRSVRGRRGGA